jgi:hypothetical protein
MHNSDHMSACLQECKCVYGLLIEPGHGPTQKWANGAVILTPAASRLSHQFHDPGPRQNMFATPCCA